MKPLTLLLTLICATAHADMIAPYRALCTLQTPGSQGSGTVIARGQDGSGLILTCRHVATTEGMPILVTFRWGDGSHVCRGVIVKVLEGKGFATDQALVRCESLPDHVIPRKVVRFDSTQGPWIAAGYRGGFLRVAGPVDLAIANDNGLISVPTPFVGGMSGGALFDRHGNVVAIVVASDLHTLGIAADGSQLHTMIREYLAKKGNQ